MFPFKAQDNVFTSYQKFTIIITIITELQLLFLLYIIVINAVELFALSVSCSLYITGYTGAKENAQDCRLVTCLTTGLFEPVKS